MKISVLMKIYGFMKIGFVASFLLVATLSYAKNSCYFKLDAINNQALSLKDHCASIKEFVDCMTTNCCGGGGGSCACAPKAITASTTEISESGSYCLSEDVFSTITVTTNEGVVIDLNGYTASSLILGDNCMVKNGTVYSLGAGSNTLISNVRVNSVTGNGAGSSVLLVDCSRLTSLQNVERVVMARCTGDGSSMFSIGAGVKDVYLYDSSLAFVRVQSAAVDFEQLALYRSIVSSDISFYNSSALKNFFCYQSVIGGQLQFIELTTLLERMIIEESQIGRIEKLVMGSVSSLNASVQRSVFQNGVSIRDGNGLFMKGCQSTHVISLTNVGNVEINNVSTTSPTSAFSVSGGKNILLTDCCAIATVNGQTGYMTSGSPENLNLIRCYAKGCYNGFNIASDSGLIKDCVCDGASNNSFIASSNVRAVGNLALSVDGVPAANYNPSSGAPFDIDAYTTFIAPSVSDVENTPERSAWRNMSFELSPQPPTP